MLLDVEEDVKDPDEEAVKVYLIRFIADLPLSWYTGSVIESTFKQIGLKLDFVLLTFFRKAWPGSRLV